MRRILKIRLLFAAASLFVQLPVRALAQEQQPSQLVSLRQIYGKELEEARQAIDRADLMRADFESQYRSGASGGSESQRAGSRSPQVTSDAGNVVAAYTDVIDGYSGTQIAAYAGARLSGFFKYLGDVDKAVEQAEHVAQQYAGTTYEAKAHFELGVLYLQNKKDSEEGAKWLMKIPKPTDVNVVDAARYNQAELLYLSAQQQIAKCEFMMDRPAYATRRYDRLLARYPQFAAELENQRDLERGIYLQRKMGFDPAAAMEGVVRPDSVFQDPSFEPLRSAGEPNRTGAHAANDLGLETAASPEGTDNNAVLGRDEFGMAPAPRAQVPITSQEGPRKYRIWLAVSLLIAGTAFCLLGSFQYVRYLNWQRAGKDKSYV